MDFITPLLSCSIPAFTFLVLPAETAFFEGILSKTHDAHQLFGACRRLFVYSFIRLRGESLFFNINSFNVGFSAFGFQ